MEVVDEACRWCFFGEGFCGSGRIRIWRFLWTVAVEGAALLKGPGERCHGEQVTG